MARRLVSSSYCLTYNRSLRPRIFQSTYRSSSPGWYILCSANSTEKPRRGDRCWPARNPSTTPRVVTSMPPRRATSQGSSRSGRRRGAAEECAIRGRNVSMVPSGKQDGQGGWDGQVASLRRRSDRRSRKARRGLPRRSGCSLRVTLRPATHDLPAVPPARPALPALAQPLQRYIGLRYDSSVWEVSLVRITALAAAAVLLFAAPGLAAAQQPSPEAAPAGQREQPARAEPSEGARPAAQPKPRQEAPPRATRQEPRRASPPPRQEPRSTGEPELKRRKPDA